MEKEYIVTIDQSTAGSKVLIIDRHGHIVARTSLQHQQYYPQSDWVEHDAEEIYANVQRCMLEALAISQLDPSQLAAVSITNQRETALMWDAETGKPIAPAIVWQCQRTASICQQLKQAGHEPMVKQKTGLMLDPYFSATKWQWLLQQNADLLERAKQGKIKIGTMDSWLIWKLTGGQVHATDMTNASRTLLFNIYNQQWDAELLQLFAIPHQMLPEVKASDACFGYTSDSSLFAERIPIVGVIGDSQAALFAQQCTKPGMAKATYGTGTSVMMNIGSQMPDPSANTSSNGLVTTIAWSAQGTTNYALEAVIRSSGDTIVWLREKLGLFETYEQLETALQSEEARHSEVFLVPAFHGLAAPYWQPDARAAIIGLERSSGRTDIIAAAVKSIALQISDAVQLLETESGIPLTELRTDGGASSNKWLMQYQADLLGRDVLKAKHEELSAIGAALMAGASVNIWADASEVFQGEAYYAKYVPVMEESQRLHIKAGWQAAIQAVLKQ
ncbi:FGGY family carbohydrate kinase [Paenibacillus yanchengensis]|uniref:ATP:glycerol 3-phosphotransferase n=1 Tax=Paenibacillus yanchengensis TaxID=2035833 RepID=A0ABW4YR60_9BACL